MSKSKSINGSNSDQSPTENVSEDIRIPNWKKISELERDLKQFRIKPTFREEILLAFYDGAINKNPYDPFNVPLHVNDYTEYFREDILRKTMVKANEDSMTRKVHKHAGNYLINVTKKGLGQIRFEIQTLEQIKNQFPENNSRRRDLEFRVDIGNKILQKYKGF